MKMFPSLGVMSCLLAGLNAGAPVRSSHSSPARSMRSGLGQGLRREFGRLPLHRDVAPQDAALGQGVVDEVQRNPEYRRWPAVGVRVEPAMTPLALLELPAGGLPAVKRLSELCSRPSRPALGQADAADARLPLLRRLRLAKLHLAKRHAGEQLKRIGAGRSLSQIRIATSPYWRAVISSAHTVASHWRCLASMTATCCITCSSTSPPAWLGLGAAAGGGSLGVNSTAAAPTSSTASTNANTLPGRNNTPGLSAHPALFQRK